MNQKKVNGWLFSPLIDFLSLGGSSLIVLPVMFYIFGPASEADPSLYRTVFLATTALDFAVSFPHFAYSYTLFYRDFPKKVSGTHNRLLWPWYIFAGIIVPTGLISFLCLGFLQGDLQILGGIVSLRIFTFGWHYSKQGLGVLTLLSRRCGHSISRLERTLLHANTHAAWMYIWALFNTNGEISRYIGIPFQYFAIPSEVCTILKYTSLSLSALTVTSMIIHYLRYRSLPPINGILAYIAATYLWTFFRLSLGESQGTAAAFMLAPFFHSLQYYTVVHKYELQRSAGALEHPRKRIVFFMGKGLLLGCLGFVVLPIVLRNCIDFTPTAALGENFFKFAFWSFINIHHFFIDNVIWRRDSTEVYRHLL